MILSSEIKPGERIREDLLAEKFGISRTPVREAVNQLVQNGFIVNVKRKGLYCVKFSEEELLDLIELRMSLESLSFDKCIERAADKDIQELKEIVYDFNEKYGRITANMGPDGIGKEISKLHNEYDVRFHVSIANVSNSSKLIKYITEVENLLLISRQRIYRKESGRDIIALSWKQHEQIVEAIEARDKSTAVDILGQHLKLMRDTQIETNESDA
ncbi:MAG: GntR family transcriptional regulator [Clostridiaceae bacterium]|nr:GntR family transcriptional regulator [Clostridiaceae bacterium]